MVRTQKVTESLSLSWDLSMWRIKASGEGIPFGHMSNYYVEAVEKPVLLIHAKTDLQVGLTQTCLMTRPFPVSSLQGD